MVVWIDYPLTGVSNCDGAYRSLPNTKRKNLIEFLYDQVSNYLDKTANFSCTRKNFFRFFFGLQIVLYGGCDGGSCKKNQKK